MTRLPARSTMLVALVLAAAAHAQSEFELPQFGAAPDAGADAGTLATPSVPPPPPAEVTGAFAAGPFAPDAGAPTPPAAPHFGPVSAWGGGTMLVNHFLQVGFEGGLGWVRGDAEQREGDEAAHAFVLIPGLDVAYGRLTDATCGRAVFCGNRVSAGPSLKAGWVSGLPGVGGFTRPQTMLFAQAGLHGGYAWIPSAPLAPGSDTFELVLRVRLGVHWSQFGATLGPKSATVLGALVFEAIPAAGFTRGVLFGATVGLVL